MDDNHNIRIVSKFNSFIYYINRAFNLLEILSSICVKSHLFTCNRQAFYYFFAVFIEFITAVISPLTIWEI